METRLTSWSNQDLTPKISGHNPLCLHGPMLSDLQALIETSTFLRKHKAEFSLGISGSQCSFFLALTHTEYTNFSDPRTAWTLEERR